MTRLRGRIESLRRRNVEFRYFIPNQELEIILDTKSIEAEIQECDVEPYDRREFVEAISQGGRKVFAILVLISQPHLIEKFVKNDQLHGSQLDDRLPYSQTDLESMISDYGARFFETQWEVLAPLFSNLKTHRILHDHSIIPFTKETYIDSGGFGEVHEVELYLHHQKLVESNDQVRIRARHSRQFLNVSQAVKVVRKRMRECTPIEDFRNELRVLSYLRCLEHPNILQLLGSYTHRNKHSLIFPLAGENVEQLMTRTNKPPEFNADHSFLESIADLASALDKVHTFMSRELDVKFIGCHFDIKPTNILVIEGKLVLADFGIARLKKETLDSRTIFKGGGGHYLAPECQNVVDGFQKHSVGRSSDIWSFGCVLLELLTFKEKGALELKRFRERRESVGPYEFKTRTFYLGHDLHPEVDKWLTSLASDLTESMQPLVRLIRDMLHSNSRPTAKDVTLQLQTLTLVLTFKATKTAFLSLSDRDSHPELAIEALRFKIWGQVVGLAKHSHGQNDFAADLAVHSFYATLDLMRRAEQEVQEIALAISSGQSSYTIFSPLRRLNEKFERLLPSALVLKIRSQLEHQLLSTSDQLSLRDLQELGSLSSHYTDLSMLAAIKRMIMLSQSEEHDRPSLRVDISSVRKVENLENHEISTAEIGDDCTVIKTITEWIEYDAHWSEEKAGELLFSRVAAVVKLHQSASNCAKARTLHSRGYYHDPARHAFGVLYEFPSLASAQTGWKPHTLMKLLEATNATPLSRPSLETRYRLAHCLATALLEIHKVNWLHKSLSATNIIFFGPEKPIQSAPTVLNDPYLIGFTHSRPGDRAAFSEGPGTNTEDWCLRQEYQHPRYRQRAARYRAEYDYYSLGVVLLEIGLWRGISSKLKLATRKSPLEKQMCLVDEWVPHLGFYMGAAYQEVVRYCLQVADRNLDLEKKEETGKGLPTTDINLAFEAFVVEKLAQQLR